jgi:hypothetical protein
MNLDVIKIDTWWKAVLVLGVIAAIGASIFDFNFIERKHLFGLGLGMILIGVGHWIAFRIFSTIAFNGILSWNGMKHNPVSVILIATGIIIVILFGFLLIKSLI